MGAFFFAMRSCEYVRVQGPRKTKLLTVKNICFFKGNWLRKHSDPLLSNAECISITFEHQKRDVKNDVITQHGSGNKLLCPVKVWVAIVQRILSYPGSSSSDTVNTFCFADDGKRHLFSGTELLKKTIGHESLGFTAKQIGLHSARSGAAMAMF